MASGRRLLPISSTVWHLALCLTVVALLARAFVPAGFMPDAVKLKHGTLALTFCSVNGEIKTLDVDVFGAGRTGALVDADHLQTAGADDASHSTDNARGVADCPYGVSSVQAVLAGWSAPAYVAMAYHAAAPPALRSATTQTAPSGSPVGSRAPPSALG